MEMKEGAMNLEQKALLEAQDPGDLVLDMEEAELLPLSLQPPGTPPLGFAKPFEPSSISESFSVCERQGGQPLLPQWETGA